MKLRQESNCRNFISAASIKICCSANITCIMFPTFLRREVDKRGGTAPKIPFSTRGSAINPSNYGLQNLSTISDIRSATPPISLRNQQNAGLYGNLNPSNYHSLQNSSTLLDTNSALPPNSLRNQEIAGLKSNVYSSASTTNEYEKLVSLKKKFPCQAYKRKIGLGISYVYIQKMTCLYIHLLLNMKNKYPEEIQIYNHTEPMKNTRKILLLVLIRVYTVVLNFLSNIVF